MNISLFCFIVLLGIVQVKPSCIKKIVIPRDESGETTTVLPSYEEENSETTTEVYTEMALDDVTATELSYTVDGENYEVATNPSGSVEQSYYAIGFTDVRQCPEGYNRTPSGCKPSF